MPDFIVTSPEGKKFRVTAPEGASQDEILAYAQKNMPQAEAPKTGPVEAALIGAGKTFTRLGQGAQQGFYALTGNDKAAADLKARVEEENRLYAPLAAQRPIATAIGEGAPAIPLGPVGMGVAAAAEYGTPQERALRGAGGFVGGKVGEATGKLIGRVAQPIRESAADLFAKFGVNGTPGQITGSRPMQWLESTLAQFPGGGRVRDVYAGAQSDLNRATMRQMGAAGDMVTPEAVQAGKSALGVTFGEVPKGVVVKVDDKLLSELGAVEKGYLKNLSPDQKGIVKQYLDDILAQGEAIPGDVYQKARSRIAARASSTQDSELKTALSGIYKALDRAFDRSASPEASAAMATARSQYRAAKTIEPLATAEGNVSPARLANAAKGAPGGLGELAQLGSKMRALPMSGTAERLMYQSLLSGGVGGLAGLASGDPEQALKYAGGAFAAPWLASQMITRAPVKQYLTQGMFNVTPEVEKWLIRAGAVPGGLLGRSLAQ